MKYVTLEEALVIAESVTGVDAEVLAKASRLDLLDSALHAPQAGFGDEEFYPRFAEKAAVLAHHIVRNHPLPDGNKRLAWMSLRMFCVMNDRHLTASTDDAVEMMLGLAAGEIDEAGLVVWLDPRLDGTEAVEPTYAPRVVKIALRAR